MEVWCLGTKIDLRSARATTNYDIRWAQPPKIYTMSLSIFLFPTPSEAENASTEEFIPTDNNYL